MKRAIGLMAVALAAGMVLGEADKVELAIKDGVTAKVPFCPPRDELSVALWMKTEVPQHVNQLQGSPLAQAGNGWNCGFSLQLKSRKDGTYFPLFSVGAEDGIGLNGRDPGADNLIKHAAAVASEMKIVAGRWHHVCGTWDGVNIVLYVDGKVVATDTSNRGYVRKGAENFEAGTTTWTGNVRPLPHLSEKVAAWTRVLTAAEIAALAADRPNLPDTPEAAALLDRAAAGERFSAKKLLAVVTGPLSPKGRIVLDGALAFGYLVDGDLAQATAAKDRYVKGVRMSRYTDFVVSDFEFAFSEAMLGTGFGNEAAARLKALWEEARDAKEAWAPVAAKEYAAALRRLGQADEAKKVEQAGVAANGSGFFPHLNAEAGIETAYNARPQAGARVSREMPAKRLYVATDGDDAADGSRAHPFKSLLKARDAVRALKAAGGLPAGGVAVVLRGGTYPMTASLELDARDSGERDRPVVWCAEQGERVVLDGGWTVPAFTKPAADDPVLRRVPAEARDRVRVADVKGYPRWNEKMKHYSSGMRVADVPELILGNRRLAPARYPNDRWLTVSAIAGKQTLGKYGNRLAKGAVVCGELAGELERWAAEPELFATGYWRLHWSDLTSQVKSIDLKTGIMEIDRNPDCLVGGSFFFLNAAAALDAPGEWYLDRARGRLYVIPVEKGFPKGLVGPNDGYRLSSFDKPFVSAKDVHDLRLEGLVLECGRNVAISLSNCRDTVVAGNVVRHFAGQGLLAREVRDLTVRDNVFRSFSCCALELLGGDRKTLTHAGILVANNEITDVENRVRTYTPCLQLGHVGAEVSNNEFAFAPSSAMRLEGNDFWIVSNLVHDVVYESDDQGAVDIYRDPSYQGNRYCWNVWRDCSCTIPKGFSKRVFRGGIRFDGNISGQTVYANRFIRVGTGEFGGVGACGGRLNVVDNNVFIDCARGMSFGVYPLKHWQTGIRKSVADLVLNAEKGVDITRPPYSTRYPGLAKLFETDQVNWLTRNVMVGPQPIAYSPPFATVFRCNRVFAEEPDWAKLERETGFVHVPTADEVGPKPTPAFVTAKGNDR